MQAPIRNAMTIDVEDYFQVSAFAPYVKRADWEQLPCRAPANVARILGFLDEAGVKATFFTLGWIAERHPQLVRDIVAGGHELASHGYGHERASDLSPAAFADDIVRAKKLLEDIAGVEVKGYRAPSFSIGVGNLWAFDVLAEAGYRYSSSVYPIQHDHYGMPDAPRWAHPVRDGLIEVPVTTNRFGSRNLPSSGGGYFRLLPYGVSRWLIGRVNQREQQAAVFYFHPWEIDPAQPRVEGIDAKSRFRHYLNLERTEARIRRLLGDFAWGRMDEIFLPPRTEMDAPLQVRPLKLDEAAACRAWDAYVRAHPQATFFHLSGWARVVEKVWGHRCHLLAAWQGERLLGLLPLGEIDSLLFGHSLSSLPFAVYGGVVADDENAASALEAAALSLARSRGASHLELRHLHAQRHAAWPQQTLYVSFRKTLAADDETNMLAIPRKQRAMVRKGIANGLRAEVDADAARFYELFASNVHRHGTPAMPRAWFDGLLAEFGSDAEVLTVVSAEGKPLSSVLSFYFRDEVLPYYAGDDLAARDFAANDFKYWALMQHAVRRGARLFDYGRSKLDTGPYHFKKNWGFSPQPLHYEFQLLAGGELPQHNPNNPKYRLVIEAWRRLPRALVDRLGPLLVKNLG